MEKVSKFNEMMAFFEAESAKTKTVTTIERTAKKVAKAKKAATLNHLRKQLAYICQVDKIEDETVCRSLSVPKGTISTDLLELMYKLRQEKGFKGLGFSTTGLSFFSQLTNGLPYEHPKFKESSFFGFALSFLQKFRSVNEQKRFLEYGIEADVYDLIERAISQKFAFKGADRTIIGFDQYIGLFAAGKLTELFEKDGKQFERIVKVKDLNPKLIEQGYDALALRIVNQNLTNAPLPIAAKKKAAALIAKDALKVKK